MSYVYVRSEPNLYTVGYYSPDGRWHPDSDFSTQKEAGKRVIELNGGPVKVDPLIVQCLEAIHSACTLQEISPNQWEAFRKAVGATSARALAIAEGKDDK
jgi:hypothetical protein